jgi:hydrogenase maturation protease
MQTAEQNVPAPTAVRPILVLGVGNLLLRDEGVGVHVVRALGAEEGGSAASSPSLPSNVEVVDGATAGFGLVDILADRRKVIVIDAVQAAGEPGAVLRLTLDDVLPSGTWPLSLHEIGFLEALAATARLGCAPGEVVIFGVRPAVVDYGLELSPPVAAAVPRIVALVRQELGLAGMEEDRR